MPAEDPAELLAELDGCADEHFKAMSLIHALGWRDIPTRLRRAGAPLDFLCSGEMNSPCAKSLPAANCLYAPLGAACPPPQGVEVTQCGT